MRRSGEQGFSKRGPHASNVTTISALFHCGVTIASAVPAYVPTASAQPLWDCGPLAQEDPPADRRTPAGLRSATAAARYARASRQQSATGSAGAARQQQPQRRRPRRYGLLGRQRRSDHVVAWIINPSGPTIVAVLLRLRVDTEATLTSGIQLICPGRVRSS